MSTDKPSRNEDEYFAKQNAELMIKTRAQLEEQRAAEERGKHIGKCPKDGYDLATETHHGVEIDTCPHCHGIWLDRGELEAIGRHEDRPGLLGRFFGDIITGIRTTHLPRRTEDNVRHEPGNPHS
jgi:Zn-finger nucleic acid-binding protein